MNLYNLSYCHDLATILQGKLRWFKENQQRAILLCYYVAQMKLRHGVVESIITEHCAQLLQKVTFNGFDMVVKLLLLAD